MVSFCHYVSLSHARLERPLEQAWLQPFHWAQPTAPHRRAQREGQIGTVSNTALTLGCHWHPVPLIQQPPVCDITSPAATWQCGGIVRDTQEAQCRPCRGQVTEGSMGLWPPCTHLPNISNLGAKLESWTCITNWCPSLRNSFLRKMKKMSPLWSTAPSALPS